MVEIARASTDTYKSQLQAIRQASKKYAIAADNISVANKRISSYILRQIKKDISNNYDFYIGKIAPYDIQDNHDYQIDIVNDGERWRLVITGDQVVYDEFGTGERGMESAISLGDHPANKNNHILPYNSGKTIREDSMGYHYWRYNSQMTYGVPQGRFVYDAYQKYADGLAKKLGEEELKRIVDNKPEGSE